MGASSRPAPTTPERLPSKAQLDVSMRVPPNEEASFRAFVVKAQAWMRNAGIQGELTPEAAMKAWLAAAEAARQRVAAGGGRVEDHSHLKRFWSADGSQASGLLPSCKSTAGGPSSEDGSPPAGGGEAGSQDGSPLAGGGAASSQDASPLPPTDSLQDGTPLAGEGEASGSPLAGGGAASSEDGSLLAGGDTASSQDGSPLAGGGAAISEDGSPHIAGSPPSSPLPPPASGLPSCELAAGGMTGAAA